MRKPHFSYLRLFCQVCCLIKGHMLIFYCLCRFFFFSVHSFAYKQVWTLCILPDRIRRSCICTIGKLNSSSRWSKDHLRRQYSSVKLYCLTFLKMFPVFLRNFLFCCPLHIKFAGTVDLNRITVTDHIMFYTKCFQTISIHLKNLFWLCNFSIVDFKWQFRRDHSQRTHHSLQTFRSNQSKRFLSVRISHCKKKSRKSADMISMVMCETNYIDRFKTPSLLF